MKLYRIAIFVDETTAPTGLLQGLFTSAEGFVNKEIILLTPEDLAAMAKGLLQADLFVCYHSDTYAKNLRTILLKREEAGLASLYLNQPFLRERCTEFGDDTQHLRYTMGFPHGKAYLGYPDPAYDPPAFLPLRQKGEGEFPLIIMPTDGAAILHGWGSAQAWKMYVLERAAPSIQPYRKVFHPSTPEGRSGEKLADLLPRASRVLTLQSAAAFTARAMGIPVHSNQAHHPIGAYYAEYGGEYDASDEVLEDMFRRTASHDAFATSTMMYHLMRQALQDAQQAKAI